MISFATTLWICYRFIFGAAIGSFLGVVAERLPFEKSIGGRSQCDGCGRRLAWWELVPLVSFVAFAARSSCCRVQLSWWYPVIECVTGIAFVLLPWRWWLFASVCIAVVVSDARYQIIPDTLLWIGMIGVFAIRGGVDQKMVFSGAIVMSILFLCWLVTRGRAMGFGDIKLIFILGMLCTPIGAIAGLYGASVLATIWGVVGAISRIRVWRAPLAFGPWLVVGYVCVYLFLSHHTM